jgi:hypothetical protein
VAKPSVLTIVFLKDTGVKDWLMKHVSTLHKVQQEVVLAEAAVPPVQIKS